MSHEADKEQARLVIHPSVAPSPQPLRVHVPGEAPATSTGAASTIHVTIGRIEVRATPPAAPPPRARAGAAVMSLDEYLRQRNAGGGR